MGGSGQSKLQTNISEAIHKFAEVVDCIKSSVTGAVKEIFGNENMKEAFKTLINTNQELNKEEKDAVKQLQNCIEKNEESKNAAADAVDKIFALARKTKQALLYAKANERKIVLKNFIIESKAALDEITKAKDSFVKAKIEFQKASASLSQLQNWCDRKKIELDAEENKRAAGQRGVAYGTTAGVSVALGAVLCLTGVGAVAGAGLMAGGLGASWATAVGVTEGVTIKDLKKMYDTTRASLEKSKENFKSIGAKVDEGIVNIVGRVDRLRDIMRNLESAQGTAENLEQFSEMPVEELKSALENLEKSCNNYRNV